jgi:hypothetical protein
VESDKGLIRPPVLAAFSLLLPSFGGNIRVSVHLVLSSYKEDVRKAWSVPYRAVGNAQQQMEVLLLSTLLEYSLY